MNRRDFLKYSALGLSGLAFRPYFGTGEDYEGLNIARVATKSVSVYSRPDDKSTILYQRFRDDLVNVYYEVVSEYGPEYNPIWFRVWRGYIHSGHMQRVRVHYNPVVEQKFPEKGHLAEVTVPISQPLRYLAYKKAWEPTYPLYYGSLHWIVGIDPGPDGEPWYRLHDELTEVEYHAPATHFRLIQAQEYTPLATDVKATDKRIEVSIARQELIAYEKNEVVLRTRISSGVPDNRPRVPGYIPTDTPTGEYNVSSKMPSKHMGDGTLTSDPNAYELFGVPWTTFFVPDVGVAFHGTFWHNNHGIPMSHGCINMKTEEALWIYRWTTPACDPNVVETRGYGTKVIVK